MNERTDEPAEHDAERGQGADAGTPPHEPVSPGAMIRAARERAGLGPDELAAQLHLARGVLEALEHDQFERLSEPVYARGYYRKCAKALVLPEQELLAAYESRVQPKAPAVAPLKIPLAGGTQPPRRTTTPRSLLLLLLIAAAVGAGIWLWQRPPMLPRRAPVAAPVMPPRAVPPPATPNPSESQPPRSPLSALDEHLGSIAAEPGAAEPGTAETPEIAPPIAPAAAPGGLKLSFNERSWAHVEDSAGAVLLDGVRRRGEVHELSGQPPYSVYLGYAPGVAVEFDGQPVDLKPYTRDNHVARLTLPPSQ